MNIRVTIVLIVGSMIAASGSDGAVAGQVPSITSVATSNPKTCFLMDDNNQSGFDLLAHCDKKNTEENWIFGLRMSETAEGTKVELCMLLKDASSNYDWNDPTHIHENALECQEIVTKGASPQVNTTKKKVVKKYHAIDSSITRSWNDALEYCEKHSMKLATVESDEENAQISALLIKNQGYWLSGYEPVRNEGFKWKSTNKSFSYTNWARNEPSRTYNNEHQQYDSCVEIANQKLEGVWNDHACNALRPFVCEERI